MQTIRTATVEKLVLNQYDVRQRAMTVAGSILEMAKVAGQTSVRLYGVPRGGIPAAYAVSAELLRLGLKTNVVEYPTESDYIVDDIIDSGKTRTRYQRLYTETPFFALVDKLGTAAADDPWIVFPWEQDDEAHDESATDIVVRLLQRIGEDPTREGLLETPRRVIKAWDEWFSGYKVDVSSVLKTFTDGASEYKGDEFVLVSNIPVYSFCEHHMAAIFGHAHVAYIPQGKIVGLSKMNRLVEVFARRLQVQERLTNQIADAIDSHLRPRGVGVLVKARHMCMESRGVRSPGQYTTTSALRGNLLLNASSRQEFMALVAQAEAK